MTHEMEKAEREKFEDGEYNKFLVEWEKTHGRYESGAIEAFKWWLARASDCPEHEAVIKHDMEIMLKQESEIKTLLARASECHSLTEEEAMELIEPLERIIGGDKVLYTADVVYLLTHHSTKQEHAVCFAIHVGGTIKEIPKHASGWMDKTQWTIYVHWPTKEQYFHAIIPEAPLLMAHSNPSPVLEKVKTRIEGLSVFDYTEDEGMTINVVGNWINRYAVLRIITELSKGKV